MKRFTTAFIVVLLALGFTSKAQQFTIGELSYEVTSTEKKTCEVIKGDATQEFTTKEIVLDPEITYQGTKYTLVGIGEYAFDLFTSLATLTIPATVEYINTAAFFKTTALRNITCLGTTPPDIESSPFATTIYTNGILHVPAGCWYKYQMSWRRFTRVYEPNNFDVTVDGKKYTIISPTDKYASLIGGSPVYSGDFVVPKTFTYEDATYTVVEIGRYAFNNCSELTSVTLPDGLLGLNDYAFQNCSLLKEVKLPETVMFVHQGSFKGTAIENLVFPKKMTRVENITFQNLTTLKTVTLPEECNYIGSSCFYGCTALTDVINGAKIETISSAAFSGCTKLVNFTMPTTLKVLDNNAFLNTGINFTNVPLGVTKLDGNTFKGCYNLKNVVIHDNVTTIGSGLFQDCAALESVVMPKRLEKELFPINVFNGCVSLKSVNLPENVSSVAGYTFRNCKALKQFTIPESVTQIDNYAFAGSGITSIKLPEGVKLITNYGFRECPDLEEVYIPEACEGIGTGAFYKCTSLKSINIPSKIVEISSNLFNGCTSLQEVTMSPKANHIYTKAFLDCTALKSFTSPDSLAIIDANAFQNCSALESFTFSEAISTIAKLTFNGCTSLKTINCPALVPPVITEDVFDEDTYKNATLIVPAKVKADYAAAEGWKNFNKVSRVDDLDVEACEIYGGIGCIYAPDNARVFNLSGIETGKNNLPAGLYIVKTNSISKKVIVK